MKMVRNILKILFVFTIFLGCLDVYGYNLTYKTQRVNGTNSPDYSVYVTTPVQAHPDTIAEAARRTKNADGWITATAEDKDTSGGSSSFSSFYYVFAPSNKLFTVYTPGFNTSSSNTTNNNIYYDTSKVQITQTFDNLGLFIPKEANISENQTTRTTNYTKIYKTDSTKVELIKWKVIGKVVIHVFKISDSAVDSLLQKFTPDEISKGIRFSNGLRTKYDGFPSSLDPYKSDMDTAWLYFKLTIGNGWDAGGRGFKEAWTKPDANDTGTYKPGASVANEYDNIILLPSKTVKRNIYVNHVDEAGNPLTGFQNSSLDMVVPAGTTRANVEPKSGFQEHYLITGTDQIKVRKSSASQVNGITYTYVKSKSAAGTTLAAAKTALASSTASTWTATTKIFATSTNKVDDFVVVNMIYTKSTPNKREIYVNHVDEDGNLLPGFAHSSLDMISPEGTTRNSTDPKLGYQEHYTITGSDQIQIRKSDVNNVGSTVYNYIGSKHGIGTTPALANTAYLNNPSRWTATTKVYGTNTNKTNDCVVIYMVYSKKPIPKREIYVNHVDQNGNVLPGFENSTLDMSNPQGDTRENSDPKLGYQEHYTIMGTDEIKIRKSSETSIGNTTYTFLKGESGTGANMDFAKGVLQTSGKETWTSDERYVTTNSNGTSDCMVINLIYSTTPPIKREIYINHVDQNGNVLPGFENSMLDMSNPPGTTRDSTEPKMGYQEHYTIIGSEAIEVRKSSASEIDGATYTFIRGEAASGLTLNIAENAMQFSKYTWTSDPQTFKTSTNSVDDYVVINLVYNTPNIDLLTTLELVGRLEFINRDPTYINATISHEQDYIPSTKQLTPYAQDAYPYVVRALRYEPRNVDFSSSATVTANISYTWDIWTYSHGNNADNRELTCTTEVHTHSSSCYTNTLTCTSTVVGHVHSAGCYTDLLTCGKTEHTHTDIWGSCYSHKHTSACDWYKTTSSSSGNRVFNYSVPYTHTWFEITNFKMYRISNLEVYDDESNIGGTLFDGGTYTVEPSGTYELRFNASRGIIRKTLIVTFPSKSYNLTSVYEPMSKPANDYSTSSGTSQDSSSTALSTATAKLNAETHKTASDATALTITYQYGNDYVELDGTTNMLQQNYKSWSERIEKEIDDTNIRSLDSTKIGTGQINGLDLNYTYNLMSYMKPSTRLTTDSDFVPNYQTVPSNRENGIRELKGKIKYTLVNDSKYNVGSNDFESTDSTYQLNSNMSITNSSFGDQSKKYENADVNKVNVLTPANYGSFELITDKKVDHSTGAGNSTILQKNAEFTITPTTVGSSTAGYSISDTREFIKGYYFIFDFNILYDGRQVPSYQPIYVEGADASITAKTTDSFDCGSADQLTNSVKIVAITTNITDALKEFFDNATYSEYSFMDSDNNVIRNTNIQNQTDLLTRADIVSDSYHAIYKRIVTKNIGRIFDFAVTDCSDIAFKSIFKKTVSGNVNEPTGISYYSGYRKWNLYSQEYNELEDRTDIGSNPTRILPLGPYKHTDARYVNAPKMGYRISFDLKTTGYMAANNFNNSRTVEITPKYYYISKDGKIFDNNIKLYFKNPMGNYINFASSGYTIYYKPNDGYRYLRNSEYTDDYTMMSTKLEPLNMSSKIVLNNKSMSISNTSFIQAWYGEFKLPNSTIAVSNIAGNVHNNINNPYKYGYIGVIFDIKCIDTGRFTISYNTSDKSADSPTNTSQWDYEGFMNFRTPGSAASIIRYSLEKDIWNIDNARYQDIKGTVVLFDLDNRAANDFE